MLIGTCRAIVIVLSVLLHNYIHLGYHGLIVICFLNYISVPNCVGRLTAWYGEDVYFT